ncbi:MAG TPA: response regulator [Gemmatimonadales bacterium]|nr:response regulator [Gemmatimonadales bacterium]
MMHRLPCPLAPEESGGAPIGILVVDDEPMIRDLAARTLERGGFKVFRAEHGTGAIALLEQCADAVRLVVLDLTMPGLSGEQTLAVIHARWPSLRTLLMSGHNMQSMDAFRSKGVVGFIEKPYLPHELLHLVEDTLGL